MAIPYIDELRRGTNRNDEQNVRQTEKEKEKMPTNKNIVVK